tara:strand:- start:1062 stop:1274 length:213 start_codon:yes stop_codon:yes gene_type:complete
MLKTLKALWFPRCIVFSVKNTEEKTVCIKMSEKVRGLIESMHRFFSYLCCFSLLNLSKGVILGVTFSDKG